MEEARYPSRGNSAGYALGDGISGPIDMRKPSDRSRSIILSSIF
jgi:hypothetical protein